MAKLSERQIRDRSELAWKHKTQWEPLVKEAYDLALPIRSPYLNTTDYSRPQSANAGQRKLNPMMFDSTLMGDAIKLVNRIQSDLMPPWQTWASLEPGPFVPQDQRKAATVQLQALNTTMFTALHISSFDMVIVEWLTDLVIAGTAFFNVQPADGPNRPLNLCAPSQASVAIEEGPWGEVWGYFQKHRMALANVKETWTDAVLSDEWKRKIADTHDAGKDDVNLMSATIYDPKDDVWRYYVISDDGEGKSTLLLDREYALSLWNCARWMKVPGEIYGRSQVMMALPDAKTLNRVKELILRNAALSVSGVWMSRSRGVNTAPIRIQPGAVIPVRSTGGPNGADLARLDVGGDLQMAQLIIQDMINSIHSIMMNKALPDPAGPVRSATEIIARMKELAQDIGAPISRIISEGIVPIMENSLYALGQKGVIPKLQNGAIRLNGGMVQVTFKSQLAQAQNLADVENLTKGIQIAQMIDPQSYKVAVKTDEAIVWVWDKLGIPAMLTRDDDERSQILGEIAKQAQAAQGAAPPVAANGNGAPPVQQAA